MDLVIEHDELQNPKYNVIFLSGGYIGKEDKEEAEGMAINEFNERVSSRVRQNRLESMLEQEVTEYIHNANEKKFIKLFFDFDSKSVLGDAVDDVLDAVAKVVVDVLKKFQKVKGNLKCDTNECLFRCIREAMVLTTNTDPAKTSYHIFCTNVFVNEDALIKAKSYINEIMHGHKYYELIDTKVYRKNTSLRCIYAYKPFDTSNVKTYHVPVPKSGEEMVYSDYLFSVVEPERRPHIFIELNSIQKLGLEFLPFSVNKMDAVYCLEKALMKHYIHMKRIQENYALPVIENKNEIRAMKNGNRGSFSLQGPPLIIQLSICFCQGQRNHKNKLGLYFYDDCMKLMKLNGPSCEVLNINYRMPSTETMAEYLGTRADVVFRIRNDPNNIFLAKKKYNKMVVMKEDMGALLKKMRKIASDHMLIPDHAMRFDEKLSHVVQAIPKYVKRVVEPNEDPFMLQFNNGVLWLRKDNMVFLRPPTTKHVFNYYNIERDYEEPDRGSDSYLTKRKEVEDFLSRIVSLDSKEGSIVWRNLAQSLLHKHNQVITFIVGPGSSGKTTLLQILRDVLGPKLCHTLKIQVYTEKNIRSADANSQTAQMNHKQLVQSVEPEHGILFNSGTIRQMTETSFPGRNLYENNKEVNNFATQVILANSLPKFDDYNDIAIARRIAVAFVDDTYFIPPEVSENKLERNPNDHRKVVKADPAFENKIRTPPYLNIVLDILYEQLWKNVDENKLPFARSTGTERYKPSNLVISMIRDRIKYEVNETDIKFESRDGYERNSEGVLLIKKTHLKRKLSEEKVPHAMFLVDIIEDVSKHGFESNRNFAWKSDLVTSS